MKLLSTLYRIIYFLLQFNVSNGNFAVETAKFIYFIKKKKSLEFEQLK